MYCRNCGKKVEDNSTFCSFCGKEIKKSESKMKNRKVYLLIVLIVFLMLAFIVVGKSRNEETGESGTLKKEELNNLIEKDGSTEFELDNEEGIKKVYLCTLEWHPNDEKRVIEYDDYGNLLKKEYFVKDATVPYYIEEYGYDQQGRQISRKISSEDGLADEWVENTYDNNGNLIEEKYLDYNEQICEIVQHKYNQRGDCLSSKYIQQDNDKVSYEIKYEYDSSYVLHKKTEYAYDVLSATTIYTQEGNVFKETVLDETGQLMHGKESHYDNGIIQREYNFNANGEIYLQKVYFYNEDGTLNLIRYHDGENKNYKIDSYEYDENGNVLSLRETYLNGLEGSTEYAIYYRYEQKEVKVYDLNDFISDCSEKNYNKVGNTMANMLEGGYVATQGDWMYYALPQCGEWGSSEGKYCIYKEPIQGGNVQLIYVSQEDDVEIKYLNVVGDYIFFQERTLKSIRTDGKELKEYGLYTKNGFYIMNGCIWYAKENNMTTSESEWYLTVYNINTQEEYEEQVIDSNYWGMEDTGENIVLYYGQDFSNRGVEMGEENIYYEVEYWESTYDMKLVDDGCISFKEKVQPQNNYKPFNKYLISPMCIYDMRTKEVLIQKEEYYKKNFNFDNSDINFIGEYIVGYGGVQGGYKGLCYCTIEEYMNDEYHQVNGDEAWKIFTAGDWIYYNYNNGIYRIRLDGSGYQKMNEV